MHIQTQSCTHTYKYKSYTPKKTCPPQVDLTPLIYV